MPEGGGVGGSTTMSDSDTGGATTAGGRTTSGGGGMTSGMSSGGSKTSLTESGAPKAPTTTISTIAVQSGNTRIVLALLQSAEWLELRVVELTPGMCVLGSTLEETQALQRAHEDVLSKLQSKQSPVEDLLNQADQLISTQRPRAEVYAAMAESLGLAWKNLNGQLDTRKQVLDMSLAFHTRARQYSDAMDAAERLYTDNVLPGEAETVRQLLAQLHDHKRNILEASMYTLQEAQQLLNRLKSMATEGATLDSRPQYIRTNIDFACSQVEHYLESLHDRRRFLDGIFSARKHHLEQCLTLCILYQELTIAVTNLKKLRDEVSQHQSLGESQNNTEILLHEHLKREQAAKEQQDKCIHLLKTAEGMCSTGHYAGVEARGRAYSVLEAATALHETCDTRTALLQQSILFFKLANTALTKFDQAEVQVATLTAEGSQRLSVVVGIVEEAVQPALTEGYAILEVTGGRNQPHNMGISEMIELLERRRANLSSLCVSSTEQVLQRTELSNSFLEQYNSIESWLNRIGDAFLQGHQDPGGSLSLAKDFLHLHLTLNNDVMEKKLEIDALVQFLEQITPEINSEDTDSFHDKIKSLMNHWTSLKNLLDVRIQLSEKYVKFHEDAEAVTNELEALELLLRDAKGEDRTDQIEAKWESVQKMYLDLTNSGKLFCVEAKNAQDPYLDVNRAVLCVETILEHLGKRRLVVTDLHSHYYQKITVTKEMITMWKTYRENVTKMQKEMSGLETDFCPLLRGNTANPELLAENLENRLSIYVQAIKKSQEDIQNMMTRAEVMSYKGDEGGQRDEVISSLLQLYQNLQNKATEFQILSHMLIQFLKNISEIHRSCDKLESQFGAVALDVGGVEGQMLEHEASRQAVLELLNYARKEADAIIKKIREECPTESGSQDIAIIEDLLQRRGKTFEEVWTIRQNILEKQLKRSQYHVDLQVISDQLRDLSEQLGRMRGNYGDSLGASMNMQNAFGHFQTTVDMLETRIHTFTSTAIRMLGSDDSSGEIKGDIEELENKWSTFHMQVGESKKSIEISIEFFRLVEKVEKWFKEGSKLLVAVAGESANVQSPQQAESLKSRIDVFLKQGKDQQQQRIHKISSLGAQLYGDTAPRQVEMITQQNIHMLESFTVINQNIISITENLKITEEQRKEQEKHNQELANKLSAAQAEAEVAKLATAAAEEARRAAEEVARNLATPIVPVLPQMVEVNIQTDAQPLENGIKEIPKQKDDPHMKKVKLIDDEPQHMPPVFITPLVGATVTEGIKFTFETKVVGFPIPNIEWFKDGMNISTNPDYKTSIEEGLCKLTIEETFTEDTAKFTCRASNASGIAETSANLIIKEAEPIEVLSPPVFVKQLIDSTALEGASYQLEAKVQGNPLPVVAWAKNGACVDESPDYVITYNNGDCVLRFEEVFLEDQAEYVCKATNDLGEDTTKAKLKVTAVEVSERPKFSMPLSNVMARAGQKFKLECHVTGTPTPTLTWFHNSKPIKETLDVKISFDGRVATLVTLEAFPKNAGAYTAMAKNTAGEAQVSCNVSVKGRIPTETSDSELASDIDVDPVKPSVHLALKDTSVKEGKSARLDCVIIGQPEPEVVWYHDDKPVKESNDFKLLFHGDRCSLVIQEAFLEDAGIYRVAAMNSAGEASTAAFLHIEPSPELSPSAPAAPELPPAIAPRFTALLTDSHVTESEPATLRATVTGTPTPNIAWFREGVPLIPDNQLQINEGPDGNLSVSIPSTTLDHTGQYEVVATNSAGTAKCVGYLSIETRLPTPPPPAPRLPPTFTKLITDTQVINGQPALFEAEVTGQPVPTVHWTLNDAVVSGQEYRHGVSIYKISSIGNKHTFEIPEVLKPIAGRVTIVAENTAGRATSAAQLRVVDPPPVVQPAGTQTTEESHVTKTSNTSSSLERRTQVMETTHITKVVTSSGGPGEPITHTTSATQTSQMKKVDGEPIVKVQGVHMQDVRKAGEAPPVISDKISIVKMEDDKIVKEAVSESSSVSMPQPLQPMKVIEAMKAIEPPAPIPSPTKIESVVTPEPTKPKIIMEVTEPGVQTKPIQQPEPVKIAKPATVVKHVVPTEPTQRVEPVTVGKPVVPTEPTQKAEPLKEVKPVVPTEPTQKAEPAKGFKPVVPTEPTQKAEPAKEFKPVVPTEPTQKAEPAKEFKPVVSNEPIQQAEPAIVVKPVVPTEPTKRPEPAIVTKPVISAEPTQKTEPAKEVKPVVPTEPTRKSEPAIVVKPMVPIEPTQRSEPTIEVKPVIPAEPTQKSEPAKEVKPVVPTELTRKAEPAIVVKPVVPTEPTKRPEPAIIVKPTVPTEPTQTVEPVIVVKHSVPTEPTQKVEPSKVTEPVPPVESTMHVGPVKAAEPVVPVKTSKPLEPTKVKESVKVQEPMEVTVPIKKVSESEKRPAEPEKKPMPVKKRKTIPARFLQPLQGAIAHEDDKVTLECVIDGNPDPSVTWAKNGGPTPSDVVTKKDLNRLSLIIPRVAQAHAGRYTCVVANEAGTAQCTCDLVVKKTQFPPVIGKRLQPQSVGVGERLHLEVDVTGTPPPTVTWTKDNHPITPDDHVQVKHEGTRHYLVIQPASLADSGRYGASATNSAGRAESLADVLVTAAASPIMDKSPQNQRMFFSDVTDDARMFTTRSEETYEDSKSKEGHDKIPKSSEHTKEGRKPKHEEFKRTSQGTPGTSGPYSEDTYYAMRDESDVTTKEGGRKKKKVEVKSETHIEVMSDKKIEVSESTNVDISPNIKKKDSKGQKQEIKIELDNKKVHVSKESEKVKPAEDRQPKFEDIKKETKGTPGSGPFSEDKYYVMKDESDINTKTGRNIRKVEIKSETHVEVMSDKKFEVVKTTNVDLSPKTETRSTPVDKKNQKPDTKSTGKHIPRKDTKPVEVEQTKSKDLVTTSLPAPGAPPVEGVITQENTYVVDKVDVKTNLKDPQMVPVQTYKDEPFTVITETTEKTILNKTLEEQKILKEDKIETIKTIEETTELINKKPQIIKVPVADILKSTTLVKQAVVKQTFTEENKEKELDLKPFPFKADPEVPKKPRGPPPTTPKKFIKGEFYESDYDSDYDGKFSQKWKVNEEEESVYTRIDAPLGGEKRPSLPRDRTPTPPTKFEKPPKFDGPPRPKIEFPESEPEPEKEMSPEFIIPEKVEVIPDKELPQVQAKEAKVYKSAPPIKVIKPQPPRVPSPVLQPEPPPGEGYAAPPPRKDPFANGVGVESTKITKFEDSSQFHRRFVTKVHTTRVIKFGESARASETPPPKESTQIYATQEIHKKEPLPDLEPFPFKVEPQRPRKERGPPPTIPKKFIRGDFSESDYESDIEGKIRPKWLPPDSDTEDFAYEKVQIPEFIGRTPSKDRDKTPTPPTVFDTSPPETGGPMRPELVPIEDLAVSEPSPEVIIPTEPVRKKIEVPKKVIIKPKVEVQNTKEPSPPLPPPGPTPEEGVIVKETCYVVNKVDLKTRIKNPKMETIQTYVDEPYTIVTETTERKTVDKKLEEEMRIKKQILETKTITTTEYEQEHTPVIPVTSSEVEFKSLEPYSNLEPFPFKPEPTKPKKDRGPPPTMPKRFIMGEFTESDYESDYEGRPKPKWQPSVSDTDDPVYQNIRASLPKDTKSPTEKERTPTPPTKFEVPQPVGGPLRPSVEPLDPSDSGREPSPEIIIPKIEKVHKSPKLLTPKAPTIKKQEPQPPKPKPPSPPLPEPGPQPEYGYAKDNRVRIEEEKDDAHIRMIKKKMAENKSYDIDIDITDIYDYISESEADKTDSEIGPSKPFPNLEPFPYEPDPDRPKRERGHPPPRPKKFLKGEFRESDYDSDVDFHQIQPRWHPTDSEDEPSYRRVVAPPVGQIDQLQTESSGRNPTPPTQFDQPPQFEGPPRPVAVDLPRRERRESLEEYSIPRFPKVEFKPFDLDDNEITSHKYGGVTTDTETEPETHTRSPTKMGIDKKYAASTQKMVGQQFEDMTQTFRHKAQKFAEQLVTEVFAGREGSEPSEQPEGPPSVPIELRSPVQDDDDSDIKNPSISTTVADILAASPQEPQAYRDEKRASEFGTAHLDPDSGLIYFKYDFGYEFGVILPGEGKKVEKRKDSNKEGNIPIPVIHIKSDGSQTITNGHVKESTDSSSVDLNPIEHKEEKKGPLIEELNTEKISPQPSIHSEISETDPTARPERVTGRGSKTRMCGPGRPTSAGHMVQGSANLTKWS